MTEGFNKSNLERILEALKNHQGNIAINYFEQGSQYVEKVENQNFYGTTDTRNNGLNGLNGFTERHKKKHIYNEDTPLSTLFRESHHEELKKRIEAWKPFLTQNTKDEDALKLSNFQFNLSAVRAVSIYMDLAHLVNHDALRPPLSVLADYMFQHSNLSRSKNAVYSQLKRYKKMCE